MSPANCKLGAGDSDIVQQARIAAASTCSSAGVSSQACRDARQQWRDTLQGYCPTDMCTLQMTAIAVKWNIVDANSIDDFIEEASETSTSGGEIGSFRWTMNAQAAGPDHRGIRLVAGGTMTLPYLDPRSPASADRPLIIKAEHMIAAHEARHRDAFLRVARKACGEISRGAGTPAEIFNRYFCGTGPGSNAAEQRKVDLTDGLTRLIMKADGTKDLQPYGQDYDAASYITPGMCGY